MEIQQSETGVVVRTPAKINLHLEVIRRRDDGYHELQTLLLGVALYDRLEVRTAKDGAAGFLCDSDHVGPPADNLVLRAADLVRRQAGRDDPLTLDLRKRIPVGAGLAGGSSDAAATLVALDRLWGLNWSRERLAGLAAELGSDVPFFLHLPAAIGRGRGERLTDVRPAGRLWLVVVSPDEGLSTPAVFSRWQGRSDPSGTDVKKVADLLEGSADPHEIGRSLRNDLTAAAAELNGAVAWLAGDSAGWDCCGSQMSGSGSSFFAVCESSSRAEALAGSLRERLPFSGRVFVVNSCQ